jgi:hypothetical protein
MISDNNHNYDDNEDIDDEDDFSSYKYIKYLGSLILDSSTYRKWW